MAVLLRKVNFKLVMLPTMGQVCHMSRINIQKPRPDKLPRRLFEALMQPVVKKEKKLASEICAKNMQDKILFRHRQKKEDNLYEKYLIERCKEMFATNKMIAVCQELPILPREVIHYRNKFIKNGMRLVRFNNDIVRTCITNTKYENILPLLICKNIYVVSEDIDIKQFVKCIKKSPNVVILAVIIEDYLISPEHLLKLAELPGIGGVQGELCSILGHSASKTHSLLGQHQHDLSVNLEQYTKQRTEGTDSMTQSDSIPEE